MRRSESPHALDFKATPRYRPSLTDATTVRIEPTPRGWEVTIADRDQRARSQHRARCETLEDARRVARALCVERVGPSELIVCDAYHRVAQRESLAAGQPSHPSP